MTEPARIVVENGRAVGVETARRRDSSAHAVRRLVAQSARRPSWTCWTRRWSRARSANSVARFQYNLLAPLFALHLNLREPPRYAASAAHPELARAFMVIMGLDHVDQFHDIVRHHEAGTIPPTVMWGACPTLFDPSQAPPGRHTAFMWEKLPYRLHGDAGELGRRARRARRARCWRSGGSTRRTCADAVIDSFTRSPLDVERDLPNMREGDLLVGAFTNDQVGYHRPFPGAGTYRTHIPRALSVRVEQPSRREHHRACPATTPRR